MKIFKRVFRVKFHGNPSSGSRGDTCGQIIIKDLTGAIHEHANAYVMKYLCSNNAKF